MNYEKSNKVNVSFQKQVYHSLHVNIEDS